MYGEKIPIYSGIDPTQREFMEAGLGYIHALATTVSAIPLYRIFPTKTLREYRKVVQRLKKAGAVGYLELYALNPLKPTLHRPNSPWQKV